MTKEEFDKSYRQLLMFCQCIEHDLEVVYAASLEGDIMENLEIVKKTNLGEIILSLKALDYSTNNHILSDNDYKLLNNIRTIRNYWAHQCFIDYVYISDVKKKEQKFNEISNRLSNDLQVIYNLHKNVEQFRLKKLKELHL